MGREADTKWERVQAKQAAKKEPVKKPAGSSQ
jgi:hypothetical protein